MDVTLTVDGCPVVVPDGEMSLLDVLRDQVEPRTVKDGCSPQGQCGCCTVLVDDTAVSGCLFLAAFADGKDVVTIEHLAKDGQLSPVQEAFLESGATQCGFCTPGFILMTGQLLARHPDPDDDEIKHYLSGNLCRCGTYPEIIQAVKLAARKMRTAKA